MIKLRAFTLIEILVVATIIIVLTTISISSFSTASKNARDAKRKSDMETLRQSMVLYKTQDLLGKYPTGGGYSGITSALTGGNFLSPPAPSDPTGSGLFVYTVPDTTESSFCFCANVELDKGNSSANNCTSWVTSGGDYYCVRNP